MDWLREQGFEVVEHVMVTRDQVEDAVAEFSRNNRGQ